MSSKKSSSAALPPLKKKSRGQKIRPQKERKSPPSIVKAQLPYGTSDVGSEVITCSVNPYLLTEFLFGYYARGLSDSDAVFDTNMVTDLVLTSLTLLNNGDILQTGVRAWPREIVDLYYSFRTTNYKGRVFYCNTSNLNTFITSVAQYGWTSATGLLDSVFPTSASTSSTGFYNCSLTPTLLSGNNLRDAFAQYSSSLAMVDVTDSSRASVEAFSFDITLPFDTTVLVPSAITTAALAGYVASGAPAYIRQDSFVGHEVQISKPSWMYFLRLCTPLAYIKTQAGIPGDLTRYSAYAHAVHAFPSVIGHQMGSNRGEYRGVVQLKLVPLFACLSDIVARLEALSTSAGVATAWKAAFSPSEVKLIAYGLWRAANSRYGASAYGIYSLAGQNGTTCETMYDSAGYKLFQSIRIPQVINDCLQAQKVYSDKQGVILPCYARNGSLNSVPTGFTYTGSGVGSIPDDTATISYRYFASTLSVVAKYKQFEQAFAGVAKIDTVTAFGNSMLDVTISRDSSSATAATGGNAILVSSRRPLTTPFLMSALLKTAYISYDYVVPSTIPFTVANGSEDRTKIYRQRYCVPLSGTDTIATLITNSITDGLVPLSAAASNASVSSFSEVMDPAGTKRVHTNAPLPAPEPSAKYKGTAYRLMSEVPGLKSITYGNYGGPGYTAGSRDPSEWHTKNGKYLVPAVDDEDAVYKRHDEAILAADGDYDKEATADLILHSELVQLSRSKGLSTFGRVAKAYFSPTRERAKDEL